MGNESLSQGEFQRAMRALSVSVADGFRRTDGRLEGLEQRIAERLDEHSQRIAVVEAQADANKTPKTQIAGWSSVIAGFVVGAIEAVRHLWKP